uniref:Uncharacterized protein n=1 Tax=Avena sativa TaxID=4498 RepID=A0ACD5TZS1_AVESA
MASISCSSWVVDMDKLLDDANAQKEKGRWEKHYIYRVPEWMKTADPSAYSPRLVSLGPFHHGRGVLRPMEEHKRRAMLHLVNRRSKKALQEVVAAVAEVAEPLMEAYKGLREEKSWRGEKHKDRFVAMMVMDGCFLVEAMLWEKQDYAADDPVFSDHGELYVWPGIRQDIMLLENQLPLLLIKTILAVLYPTKYKKHRAINKLILDLLNRRPHKKYTNNQPGLHPLGILHSSFTYTLSTAVANNTKRGGQPITRLFSWLNSRNPWHQEDRTRSREDNTSCAEKMCEAESTDDDEDDDDDDKDDDNDNDDNDNNTTSAQKMREAGIDFEKSATDSFLDIHYDEQRGVLRMPRLRFYGHTQVMLLNFMAFERLHSVAGNVVTAYVYFMDDIIDTAKDVELLKSKEIIDHEMGSDKELAMRFNDILSCNTIIDDSSKLGEVRQKVYAHCKKPWNKWRASLIENHFSNPWVIISLVIAAILLVATLLQTVYTMFKP